jgi:methionyl-tRNA synthetase
MISLSEFKRIDLRIGEIVAAEPIPGTDRLLKVQVDLGQEQRTLVAGLATFYTPHQLLGLKVIVVANLEPATICSVLSQGMLLGAGCSDGQDIALLTVTKQVANGTPVE